MDHQRADIICNYCKKEVKKIILEMKRVTLRRTKMLSKVNHSMFH